MCIRDRPSVTCTNTKAGWMTTAEDLYKVKTEGTDSIPIDTVKSATTVIIIENYRKIDCFISL